MQSVGVVTDGEHCLDDFGKLDTEPELDGPTGFEVLDSFTKVAFEGVPAGDPTAAEGF